MGVCGQAECSRVVVCSIIGGSSVGDECCSANPKPSNTLACEPDGCSPHWVVADWSQISCLGTCEHAVKTRPVSCEDSNSKILDDGMCTTSEKPSESLACEPDGCSLHWVVADWSLISCLGTCEHGVKTRPVSCEDSNSNILNDGMCYAEDKPSALQDCSLPCAQPPSKPYSLLSKVALGGGAVFLGVVGVILGKKYLTKKKAENVQGGMGEGDHYIPLSPSQERMKL
jgi:hypothetical protein